MKEALRQGWQSAAASFAARDRRERTLILALTLFVVALAGYLLLIDPPLTRLRAADVQYSRLQTEAADVQLRLTTLAQQLAADPDTALRAETDGLRAEIVQLDKRLRDMEDALVPPRRMNALLESILARQSGLRLVSLRTLPPTALLERKDEADKTVADTAGRAGASAAARALPASADPDLYRHGVEITLDGSYGDLLAYLAQLERAPQKLVWGELKLSVVEHPRCRMSLIVYTLSLDRTWLSL